MNRIAATIVTTTIAALAALCVLPAAEAAGPSPAVVSIKSEPGAGAWVVNEWTIQVARPSKAAHKFLSLELGDSVILTGAVSGSFEVVPAPGVVSAGYFYWHPTEVHVIVERRADWYASAGNRVTDIYLSQQMLS